MSPVFSGVPNNGEQNHKWLPHTCLVGGPKRPAVLRNPCILRDHQKGATKSEVATSPLPSRGPKGGQNCNVTLRSRGSRTKGNKIRSAYLIHGFSGGQRRAKVLRNPCVLGGPQKRGTKSEMATSPLPSRGAKRGRNSYISPAFSGVPNKEEENQKWLPHPCLLGGAKSAAVLRNPCISGDPQQGGQHQNLLPHSCLLVGPKEGGIAMQPLRSRGSPTKGTKISSACLTAVFSGARKRAKLLRDPCILEDP